MFGEGGWAAMGIMVIDVMGQAASGKKLHSQVMSGQVRPVGWLVEAVFKTGYHCKCRVSGP